MKGFKAVKSFYHDSKQFYKGDIVDFGDYVNNELEKNGLIRWIDRPSVIMPKKVVKPKAKRNARKSK